MRLRSIFYDRYGTLQIKAYYAVLDKSNYLKRQVHAPDSFVSPYFKRTTTDYSSPVTCSLLKEEADLYGYKIPETADTSEPSDEPTPSTSSEVKSALDADKQTAGPTRSIRFRSIISTGLATGSKPSAQPQSQKSRARKSIKWSDPIATEMSIEPVEGQTSRGQDLKNKLDRAVPRTTLRSAVASCRQYPALPSRYTYNKYVHLFGLKRKPEFRINKSRAHDDGQVGDDDEIDDNQSTAQDDSHVAPEQYRSEKGDDKLADES